MQWGAGTGQSASLKQWSNPAATGLIYCIKHGLKREQKYGPKFGLHTAHFSHDCSQIVTAGADRTARVYGTDERVEANSFFHIDGWVRCSIFSQDGQHVCTGCDDGVARIHSMEDNEIVKQFEHTRAVLWVDYSPDEKLLLTSCMDRRARVWRLVAEEVAEEDNEEGAAENAEGEDGEKKPEIARPDGDDLFPVDTEKKTEEQREAECEQEGMVCKFQHADTIFCGRFNPQGTQVCTASGAPRYFGVARVFDIETQKEILSFEHEDIVTSVSFSADGRWLTTSSRDKTARLYSVETGDLLRTWKHVNWVHSAGISNDAKLFCTACGDGCARIFDIVGTGADYTGGCDGPAAAPKGNGELACFKHPDQVMCASFGMSDSQLLTAASDGALRVYGTTV